MLLSSAAGGACAKLGSLNVMLGASLLCVRLASLACHKCERRWVLLCLYVDTATCDIAQLVPLPCSCCIQGHSSTVCQSLFCKNCMHLLHASYLHAVKCGLKSAPAAALHCEV